MKKIYIGILLILVSSIFVNGYCGDRVTNGFFGKPHPGANGAVPKGLVDAGFARGDGSLGKKIWIDDPAVEAALGRGTWTELSEAIKALGTTSTNLRLARGTLDIQRNLTVPAGITLLPARGAIISIAPATTLTINGGFEAGLYQVFACRGTGKVAFGWGSTKEVLPEWWGAKGDNSTDCAPAINAAVLAHRKVCLSWGIYKISNPINNTITGTRLSGKGTGLTTIVQTSLSSIILNNSAQGFEFSDCALGYGGGTPAAGATAIYSTGAYSKFHDLSILNAYFGMDISVGGTQSAHDFRISNYEYIGLYLHNIVGGNYYNFSINAGNNTTRGIMGGIRLYNQCEAITFHQGEVLMGLYPLTTDAERFAAMARPAYCSFTDVYFDSAARHAYLNNIVETKFTGGWFSNGRSSRGYPGCWLYQTDGITFTGVPFCGCGGSGLFISSSAKRTAIMGCRFESNSAVAPAGNGLEIAAGATEFSVIGCDAHNGLYTAPYGGQQRYGILVNAGSSDNYIIQGNNLTGNATGGLADGGTGTHKSVMGNI